ncbi:MAG: NADH-quinone oxidoreductase subunit J [Fibromonadales bacterium]|nr:NADH-quinone oxidoreductase subunit J [Fibromonadales bacterium]
MDALPLKDILFYITAIIMVAGALLTVTVKNVLHSAIALIGTFFSSAVLYFLLHAEFVGVAQVMVYIGGVVVFIVLAILLTSHLGEEALEASKRRKIIAAFFALLISVLAVMLLREISSVTPTETEDFASLASIGKRLLSTEDTGFILPFEAISLLLLISLIGAITIAYIPKEDKPAGDK